MIESMVYKESIWCIESNHGVILAYQILFSEISVNAECGDGTG
jgi:hypothetical protein